MNYLVYGKDEFSIKNKVKELVKQSGATKNNLIQFDGCQPNFNFGDLLEACNTIDFFNETKCIIFSNPIFIEKYTECDNKTIDNMLDYLKNPNPNVNLIMYSYELNISDKKIKKYCEIYNFKAMTLDNYRELAIKIIDNSKLKLSFNIRNLLVDYSNQDLYLLKQNIAKLQLYNRPIDEETLPHLIDIPFEEDVFKFTNAIFAKNMNQALLILKDFYANNVAPQYLIAIIASQLRFLNKVSYLYSNHLTISQIADLTKSKEYRIVKSVETINHFHNPNFLELLNKLSNLDQAIKSNNNLNPNLRLELFIVSLTRR